VKVDLEYTKKALAHERGIYEKCEKDIAEISGVPFVDSNKSLRDIFEKVGIQAGLTEKGNPSFTDANLAEINHPIAALVRTYRESYKKCSTYYEAFLKLNVDGTIHPNFRQMGTATGRMSMSNPNFQNQINEEDLESEWKIRNAIIPRERYFLLGVDYKALEFRAMLFYAGENKLLDLIAAGHDPHQATADLVGVTRKQAKTINFMLLYGGGAAKLAMSLGVSLEEGKRLKEKYFRALPKVKQFLYAVQDRAKSRGYVLSKFGMAYYFRDHHYKATNYLIQGSTAHAVKSAMVSLAEFLKYRRSYMVLQVHDEIVFNICETESHIVQDICDIMKAQWPWDDRVLDVSCEYSYKSYGEMKPYEVNYPREHTGEKLQGSIGCLA